MHEKEKNLSSQNDFENQEQSWLTLHDYQSYYKARVNQDSMVRIQSRNRHTNMPQSSQNNTMRKE